MHHDATIVAMPPASLARCFLPHTLLPSPYLHSLHYMHTFTVIRSRLRHGKSVAARPLKNSLCRYPFSLPCDTLLAELTGPVNMYHHGRVISIHVCLRTVTLPPCHTAALTCIPSTESTAFGESSSNICNRPQHGPSRCGGQKLGMIDSDTSAGV